MTKKLEELFDLPESNQIDITKEENSVITDIIAEDREVVLPNTPTNTVPEMQSALEKVDKIDAALPSVRQLDTSDKEMDDIAQLAQDTFKDLMDLGMNVEARFSGETVSYTHLTLPTNVAV